MSKRKICVVTGSRAEYGLLYWIMKEIEASVDLELQLVVTGMHLSPEFGLTYRQIEDDGFTISRKVEMLLSSDTPSGIAKSMGLGVIGFGEVYEKIRPDIVLMLGDRFELLAAASAALVAALPIAHIHGGETTEGAFDEAIRHSITKMSHLHFTATDIYRNRVIQLGESPDRVFNSGAPGIDNIRQMQFLNKKQLETDLAIDLEGRSLLVTWHPATLEPRETKRKFQNLLNVLGEMKNTSLIFTKTNADTEGRVINQMIDAFVDKHSETSVTFTSLGQLRYLSTLSIVSGVVGNSSSGIIEAPSVNTGTVNIGDRQRGRIRSASVIDCDSDEESIGKALRNLFDAEFQKSVIDCINPYDQGGATEIIVQVLTDYPIGDILKKQFFNIAFDEQAL